MKKERWCDCNDWQERFKVHKLLSSRSVPGSYPIDFYLRPIKFVDYMGEKIDGVEAEEIQKDFLLLSRRVEFCPYCGQPMKEANPKVFMVVYVEGCGEYYVPADGFKSEIFQEALENALFRPVEHFDDDIDNLHNDVWGSEGPDCSIVPE